MGRIKAPAYRLHQYTSDVPSFVDHGPNYLWTLYERYAIG